MKKKLVRGKDWTWWLWLLNGRTLTDPENIHNLNPKKWWKKNTHGEWVRVKLTEVK
ncbi:MAG: hypothetical protein PHI33_09230 [Smithellaceae bacterium]|nr:hypothetical protein [Smithellaceae bacterium]